MVRINGKTFEIYDMDTTQSIINRIAMNMKTLPKYLYFKEGIPTQSDFNTKKNIEVEDLLDFIKKSSTKPEFKTLYGKIEDKLKQQKLSLENDVIKMFIVFNQAVSGMPDNLQGSILLLIQTELDKNENITEKVNVKSIWDNRQQITQDLEYNINKNITDTNQQLEMYKELADAEELQFTEFELERSIFSIILTADNISIIELFNSIQLTPKVPLAYIGSFYKILKDFTPFPEWGDETKISLPNIILFKILQRKDAGGAVHEDYSTVVMGINTDNDKENIVVEMSLTSSTQSVSRQEYIDSFLELFKTVPNMKITEIKESNVNGSFYFPKQTLDKYVIADIILNNPLFSSLLAIDERDKATKKKDSVYVHFESANTGYITANITEKISEKGDPVLKGKDIMNMFPYGSDYVRVKITKADNMTSVELFQNIFSKLMYIYNNQYKKIVAFYRKFLPKFGERTKRAPRLPKSLKLKDIAPEVFVKGYPPKCPKQPTIIEDEEVPQAIADGKAVMTYPKTPDEGFPQRNYICEHSDAKYPGLRDNQLGNKDLVPWLPCCYVSDHANMEGKPYGNYFFGQELKQNINPDQQDFIITNKFLTYDKYGKLPDEIEKTIKLFDDDDNYMYLRKGVYNTNSSFLDCVMEGLWEQTGILDMGLNSDKSRENYLIRQRRKIAEPRYIASCKQEMYDFTDQEIIDILNSDKYLDPKYFTSLLENYLNCNIYVFTRKNTTSLSLPRHIQAFYKTASRKPCVLVYQHMGAKSDHSDTPKCELIVKWKKGDADDVTYNADYDSVLARGMKEIFNRLRKSWALNISISETIFPLLNNKDVKITEQGIDSYGKCRMLRVVYKDTTFTLLLSPIAPIPVPEVKDWEVTKVSSKQLRAFASATRLIIKQQNVMKNIVKSFSGKLGNVSVTVPVRDESPVSDLTTTEQTISFSDMSRQSVMTNYNLYKKLARYITSYVLWLYSTFLVNKNLPVGLDSIDRFQKEAITIEPDFVYGNVPKKFDMNSGVMNKRKLVLKSEETLKRLMYVLRINSRNKDNILNYHKRTVIDNYYEDITDFDQYQTQVILEGTDSVEKWIGEREEKYKLYDSVQLEKTIPYFFSNPLINDKIWLAQNMGNDLSVALEISYNWNENGYNMTDFSDEMDGIKTGFTLYSYVNNVDITEHEESGGGNIYVLGYKIEDEPFYTILLPL